MMMDRDTNVGGDLMEVTSVSPMLLSRAEAREVVGSDYLASRLVGDDWSYLVCLGGDGEAELQEGVPFPATITVENIAPISLIFKDAA